jgi:hypothetical protein
VARFKELVRIEAAIEQKNKPELDWALGYCKIRLGLRRERITKSTGTNWKDEFVQL